MGRSQWMICYALYESLIQTVWSALSEWKQLWVRVPETTHRGGRYLEWQSRDSGHGRAQDDDLRQQRTRSRTSKGKAHWGGVWGTRRKYPESSPGESRRTNNSCSIRLWQHVETQRPEFIGNWSRRHLCLGWTRIPDSQGKTGVCINEIVCANKSGHSNPPWSAGEQWKPFGNPRRQMPAKGQLG